MVSAFAVLLATTLHVAAPSEGASVEAAARSIGVVRLAHGRVSIEAESGEAAIAATTGARFAAGASVETGQGGWAEVFVTGAGRVRLSSVTRVVFDVAGLRLVSGRVWIENADGPIAYAVELPEAHCAIERTGSAVIEHGARTGSTVVVRAGVVVLRPTADGGAPVRVQAGETSSLAPGAKAATAPRVGGAGISELAEVEARAVLGDLGGLRRFLLDRVASTKVARQAPRGSIIRTTPEVSGGDPASFTLESAVRPAPFFEQEVPPKGPNVRVDVTFGQ